MRWAHECAGQSATQGYMATKGPATPMDGQTSGAWPAGAPMIALALVLLASLPPVVVAAPPGATIPWAVQDHPIRIRVDVGPLPFSEIQLPLELNLTDTQLAATVNWSSLLIVESHKTAGRWEPLRQRMLGVGSPSNPPTVDEV